MSLLEMQRSTDHWFYLGSIFCAPLKYQRFQFCPSYFWHQSVIYLHAHSITTWKGWLQATTKFLCLFVFPPLEKKFIIMTILSIFQCRITIVTPLTNMYPKRDCSGTSHSTNNLNTRATHSIQQLSSHLTCGMVPLITHHLVHLCHSGCPYFLINEKQAEWFIV